MEWFLAGWMYWWFVGIPSAPHGWSPDEAGPASCAITSSAPDPTAIDVWLIELTYEFLASESHCARCDSPLGHGLRVVLAADGRTPWTVTVVTKCRARRRHRHVATVVEASNNLMLGPFRPC